MQKLICLLSCSLLTLPFLQEMINILHTGSQLANQLIQDAPTQETSVIALISRRQVLHKIRDELLEVPLVSCFLFPFVLSILSTVRLIVVRCHFVCHQKTTSLTATPYRTACPVSVSVTFEGTVFAANQLGNLNVQTVNAEGTQQAATAGKNPCLSVWVYFCLFYRLSMLPSCMFCFLFVFYL